MTITFLQRLSGALAGIAIGDGMGGPVEGWTPERIRERFADWDYDTFPPTTDWPPKGYGRITDDTLMTEASIRAYMAAGDHLDARGYLQFLLPEMCNRKVWVPERQEEMAIIGRLNDIERYTQYRLRHFGAEPRLAGQGNALNCAIAMFIMPVGAVNVGDPAGAYREAADLGMAESHSFAVEGAATLAAAYAESLAEGATVDSVLDAALVHSHDGVHEAIKAVLAVSSAITDPRAWITVVRAAIDPFLPYSDMTPREQSCPGSQVWNLPDPRRCFMETPVALAALKAGAGDFRRTLKTAVTFGHDADSIAGMACGLCGGLCGLDRIPACLVASSHEANRRDWVSLATGFSRAIAAITATDRRHSDRKWRSTGLGA